MFKPVLNRLKLVLNDNSALSLYSLAEPSLFDLSLDQRSPDGGERLRRLARGLQAKTGPASEDVFRESSGRSGSGCGLSDLQVSGLRKGLLQNQQTDGAHENTQVRLG